MQPTSFGRSGSLAAAALVLSLAAGATAEARSGAGDENSEEVAAGQAAAPAQPPETRVDASGGGITISSGPNSLSIGARMQFRWMLEDREQGDADTIGTGVDSPDGAISSFDVPRMRVTLGGGVYRPWMRYSFQFEFSRASGEGGSRIKDAIFEIRPSGRPYRLQFGQFKAPFGLQQLTSSGRQQFVDRAITDARFTPGRDMGAMFSGTTAGTRLGYAVGVFNGSGESIRQTNRTPLIAGRFFVNPFGAYNNAEGSTDAPARAALHLGVGARTGKQTRGRTPAGIVEDPDNQTAVNGEFAFKASRFYSTAEYFWMREEVQNPVVAPDFDSRGFHVQAGAMLVPRTTEVGVRYAEVEGNTGVNDSTVREVRGVIGYFWRAHNLKVQADAGQVRYDAGYAGLPSRARQGLPGLGTRLVSGQDLADTQVRMQLQVAF
jgi:phosphate-selective porin OprO and OprP